MQENFFFFFFCSEGWHKFYILTIVILNCNILLHLLFICAIVLGITIKTPQKSFLCAKKSLVINESAVMSMICNSKTHRSSSQSCAEACGRSETWFSLSVPYTDMQLRVPDKQKCASRVSPHEEIMLGYSFH